MGAKSLERQRQATVDDEIIELYDLYYSSLLRYGMTLVRDEDGARDAVQDVFLRCSLMLSTGREIANPKAWLFRVLRNHLLDLMKTSHKRNEVGVDRLPDVLDDSGNPERQYASAEMSRRIMSALTVRECECLRLRHEGLRYREIAEVLSIHPGTVATLLSRCSVRIRELMGGRRTVRPAELRAEEPYAS
jgi:RNA polymerase sigma-70 factor, ECF subfamily